MNDQDLFKTLRIAGDNDSNIALTVLLRMAANRIEQLVETSIKKPLMHHVTKTETINSGGGCMIDLIHLDNGKVIGLDDECLVVYKSIDAFWRCLDGDVSGEEQSLYF